MNTLESEKTPPTSKISTKNKKTRSKKSFTQMNPRTNTNISKISKDSRGSSKRKTTNNTSTSIHKKKSNPTLVLSSKIPGTGLFAYTSTNSYTKKDSSRPNSKGSKFLLPPMNTNESFANHSKSEAISTVSDLTRDVEEKVENKLLKIMEDKVEKTMTDYETIKIEKMALEIEFKKLKEDFKELQGFKSLADNQIIRERELKRIFEKEVERLKEETRSNKIYIENLENKIKSLEGNLEGEQNEKQKGISKLSSESDILKARIRELEEKLEESEEVIEDLRYNIQTKEAIAQRVQDERQKSLQEMKEKRITENEQKMYKITKLVGEISDLNEKLGESEYLRKKYIEKNKSLSDENKELKKIIDKLQVDLENASKDAKSIRLAKKSNNKILEKKILKMGEELKKKDGVIEALEREITDMKEKKNEGNRFDNFEEIVPVKAKPTLFGDFE